jgi:hypothetical protein
MATHMRSRAELLAMRREMLLAECEMQRRQLEIEMRPLVLGAESLQTGMRIVGKARKHPEWLALAALGLAMIKPRRLSSFMRLGTAGMRMWRQVRPFLQLPAAQEEVR